MDLKTINVFTTVAMFASAIWGVRALFRREGTHDPLKFNVIKLISIPVMFSLLYGISSAKDPKLALQLISIAGELLSLYLFWWTAGGIKAGTLSLAYSEDAPKKLIELGTFKYLRHPFYTSYIVSYFAAAVGAQNPCWLLLSILMWMLYWRAAVFEERKFENSSLSNEYNSYRKRVGMFFPNLLKIFL